VTLVCTADGRTSSKAVEVAFPAHKIILASASSFFARLLTSSSVNKNGTSLVLVMTDVEPAMLDLVMKFVYDGSVNVESELVDGFMKACEKLEIRGLAPNNTAERLESDSVSDEAVGRDVVREPAVESDKNETVGGVKTYRRKRRLISENQKEDVSPKIKVERVESDEEDDAGATEVVTAAEEESLEVWFEKGSCGNE
jgi:hypothetical protein